ncbi:DEAD/DEAH box helicase [Limosilactobacillus sp.]|uniref:DEAD/DEAH box helicase n=1 Tax=Limosilactobacillus sp. TaxID=2773925 RepID=UPI00345EB272
MEISDFYGRRVIVNKHETVDVANAQKLPTMKVGRRQVRCLRCNHLSDRRTAALPNGQYYCRHCIQLGRVSTLDQFYHLPEPNQFQVKRPVLTWQGQLSPLQSRVSAEVSAGMARHEHRLLWAVTGAGKTEMIFPGLAAALKRGERVGLASPRVDVCLELYPRLQKAFANTPIALLHGRNPQPYHYRQLTICTTHQLLRFYRAFDNLIVDEVDAFPYAANESLLFATEQAIKKNGGLLMMTATPGRVLMRQVRRHQLAVSYLPLRFHGQPLPQIKEELVTGWRKQLEKGRFPRPVQKQLGEWVRSGQRFLFFVPHISDLRPAREIMAKHWPGLKLRTVYAADSERLAKVQEMRKQEVQALITTTIMERGVTFPGIDLGVLGADDLVFSSSALVQIAGRVGRSAKRPTGKVVFWVDTVCRSVQEAQRQIRLMNRRGRKLKDEMSAL